MYEEPSPHSASSLDQTRGRSQVWVLLPAPLILLYGLTVVVWSLCTSWAPKHRETQWLLVSEQGRALQLPVLGPTILNHIASTTTEASKTQLYLFCAVPDSAWQSHEMDSQQGVELVLISENTVYIHVHTYIQNQ